ncbi:MAG: glycosyltransferase family 2 protein [Propioniciclava sp.]
MTDIEDPWAWAHREEPEIALPADTEVTLVLVAHDGAAWLPDLVSALERSIYRPQRTVAINAGSQDASGDLLKSAVAAGVVDEVREVAASSFGGAVEAAFPAGLPTTGWLWFLHDDAKPAPDALLQLVARATTDLESTPAESAAGSVRPPRPSAVVPLLLAPRRHGVGALIAELGETVTTAGVVTSAETGGVIDQGQLESQPVLGGSTCGLLVSAAAWTDVSGFAADLPSSVQGVDLGARLTRHGGIVVTEPRAKISHVEASSRGLRGEDPSQSTVERRAYGLGFNAALRGRAGGRIATALASGSASLGHLLSKDAGALGEERAAFRRWVHSREQRVAIAQRFAALPSGDVVRLRPTRWDGLSRAADDLGGRLGSWTAALGDRSTDLGLDNLLGDDLSGSALEGRSRRWPLWVLMLAVLLVLAAVSVRHAYGLAPLVGPQLLPVPATWTDELWAYLDPVAGSAGGGAPWSAFVWLGALPFFGWTDALVTVLLVGCVPMAFVLGRWVLDQVIDDAVVASLGGVFLGLAPILVGAPGAGQLGAVVSYLLLLIVAGQVSHWWRTGQTWGGAARLGIALMVLVAFTPLLGGVAWLVTNVVAWRRPAGARVVLALGGPLLLAISPWSLLMLEFPGRLLTGIAPALAPEAVPDWWALLLGRPLAEAVPPWWLSLVVVGVLWAWALLAALRRPGMSGWSLAAASGFLAVGVAISRTAVPIPPDDVAVPQATEWVLAMIAALVLAAASGVAGLGERLQGEAFGMRQIAIAAGVVVVAGCVGLTAVWWAGWGLGNLDRRAPITVPPFIARDSERGLARVLTLVSENDTVSWAVHEGDFARLGDAERGLVFSGDAEMRDLAASVVSRLVQGTADDRLVPDLQRLGVGYVWVRGVTERLRVDIANTPGIGVGSVERDTATWVVPEGGRTYIQGEGQRTRVDPQQPIPAGSADRTLTLAEAQDPRWTVTVDGARLSGVTEAAHPSFQLGERTGPVTVALTAGSSWWIWVQAGGLLLLVIAAAPTLRPERPRSGRTGRRGI